MDPRIVSDVASQNHFYACLKVTFSDIYSLGNPRIILGNPRIGSILGLPVLFSDSENSVPNESFRVLYTEFQKYNTVSYLRSFIN